MVLSSLFYGLYAIFTKLIVKYISSIPFISSGAQFQL